ncbi:transcriptional repressor CTCF [Elysia marginata]|uniref:Transcriptional repressor CTCF n=1 Tax=Elysia marginata TaxID=1093978 RepID=A0AAV4EGF7_9GAST|nr:transcriptional repressor CTCF [Elysia marginata]
MDHEDESSTSNAGHQNLNDLHNYLTTFNKEIEPGEDVLSTIGVDTEVGDVGDLYTSSGSHSLQDTGEVTVAGQFSSGFYSEQGILDNPLSVEAGQSMHGLESVPDHDGEEDLTSSIKQEVGTMDLDTVPEHLDGFREHVQLTDTLQNQGLIMTSLADGLDPTGGKVIRIVSLGDEGQYLTLGDGSQMQILSQELNLDSTPNPDTSYAIQGADTTNVTAAPTRARSLLSLPANAHLGLSGKSSTTSLLTPASGSGGVINTSSSNQMSGVSQLVALQSGDGDLQPQLVALSPGTPLTLSADGLQQYGVLQAGETSATNEVGYQTFNVLPTDLNQEGMNYVLVMTPQDGDDKQAVAQLVDLKQESQEVREELVEVNGEVKRVLHMVPKKAYPTPTGNGGVNNGTQLMCDYCDYTSPKRYLLTRHMKSHSDERPHKCPECNRGFKTPASLINHVNTHTGTRPHKCKTCDAAFTTSGELVRHIRYKHTFEKPHRCPQCDYASVELSKLKRHMRSHTGERPYKCPHCPYASPDTYKLKRHLRIHTGEKPYECDICHARFTQSNSLKAHKLIHSGNKPVFQCTLCPTTCGRKTDLKIHFNKLHAIGSPLECKKCGQILADRYSFKQHMRTHDMDRCFKCDQCDFIANSERSLDQHAAIHNKGKKYECNLCHMTFNLQQSLEKHRLHCTLDSRFVSEKSKELGVIEKSTEESLLCKSDETGNPALPSSSQEEPDNQNPAGKTLTGLGQDIFPAPVIASDTLHKNLLQDIKAGKLGDVPQVVIVHPDGTLEEIPAAAGDKLNLDDIFSALSNTEKQERAIQNEVIQNAAKQESIKEALCVGSDDKPKESDTMDKTEDAGETVQCEASTQAEIESDSESLDGNKAMDSLSKQSRLQQEKESGKETAVLKTNTDGMPAADSDDGFNKGFESSSFSEKLGSSSQPLKVVASAAPAKSSSSVGTVWSSSISTSQSDSPAQLSPIPSSTNDNSTFNISASNCNSSSTINTPSSSSSSTPQFVVVKGYTCLSEDGNTVQPTLVNVAVDKDSLMKMFASLGPAGDGMGLQLLPGDLESATDNGEESGARIAQASIIPLHDMATLTAMGDAESANSNLLGITNEDTLTSRVSGLSELCGLAAEQFEGSSNKDSGFDSTNSLEVGESRQDDSSGLNLKDEIVNSDTSGEGATYIKVLKNGQENKEVLTEKTKGVISSLSLSVGNFVEKSLMSLEEHMEEDKPSSPLLAKPLPASLGNPGSCQKLSTSCELILKEVNCKERQSQPHTSKTSSITDGNTSSPVRVRDNKPEVKISLSDDTLSEPSQLMDVEGSSVFHLSDARSLSIQSTFSEAPPGNLFSDSLVEDASAPHGDLAASDYELNAEIDVCGVTGQDLGSDKLQVTKVESGDGYSEEQGQEERSRKVEGKKNGPTKRRASSNTGVDTNIVRTSKRVRKALVKVSM